MAPARIVPHLVVLAGALVFAPFVSIARASDDQPDDVRTELAVDVGYAYMSTRGAIAQPQPASSTGFPSPSPGGSGSFSDSGFALGGRLTVVAPYYGPGVPRALLLAGVTGFFGRDQSSTVAAINGANADSGVGLKRSLVVDLALGVVFPMCREWSCMDLRAFFGGAIVMQTVTGFTNEGSGNVQSTDSTVRTGPILGVIVTKPLCTDCGEHSLRLALGVIARSILAGGVDFTSPSGKSYTGNVSGLEFEGLAGLMLPL